MRAHRIIETCVLPVGDLRLPRRVGSGLCLVSATHRTRAEAVNAGEPLTVPIIASCASLRSCCPARGMPKQLAPRAAIVPARWSREQRIVSRSQSLAVGRSVGRSVGSLDRAFVSPRRTSAACPVSAGDLQFASVDADLFVCRIKVDRLPPVRSRRRRSKGERRWGPRPQLQLQPTFEGSNRTNERTNDRNE
jgi:hypothetical protein